MNDITIYIASAIGFVTLIAMILNHESKPTLEDKKPKRK